MKAGVYIFLRKQYSPPPSEVDTFSPYSGMIFADPSSRQNSVNYFDAGQTKKIFSFSKICTKVSVLTSATYPVDILTHSYSMSIQSASSLFKMHLYLNKKQNKPVV
jgi:hypothetical protein